MRVILNLLILSILVGVLRGQICGFQTTCVPPSDSAYASWQMFNGSQKHTGRQVMKGDLSEGRYIKWVFLTNSRVWSSPAIGDINNDGSMEVVFNEFSGNLYAIRGTDGSLLWSFPKGSRSSPAIGDVNGDGNIEVIMNSDKTYALRGTDGSLLWSSTTGGSFYSSPVIGDINNDGNIEVVVGSDSGKVYALKGTDGSVLWSYTTGGGVYSSPAIGDINNDGNIEVVVGSLDSSVYALRGTDGSLLWSFTTGNQVFSSPAIGDINNDGSIEIVIGSLDSTVYALRGTDGSLLWSYPAGRQVFNSPVIGDIDGDGSVEVFFGRINDMLYALRGTDGSLIWSYNVNIVYYIPEDIILADIDPQPGVEVITNGYSGSTYILSSSGSLLYYIWVISQRSMSVGDIDGDGCIEIVMVGDDNPQVAAVDASSNESGCGTGVYENGILKPDSYVEVYDITGRMIYRGEYMNFKPAGKGIYFVKFKGGVKKIVK